MAAQVHPIAAIVDRLRDASDLCVGLEYDGRDIRPAQQFQRGGQARRTGSGHHRCSLAPFAIHADGLTPNARAGSRRGSIFPRSRLSVTQRIEADIFAGDDEVELRILAQGNETLPGERPCGRIRRARGAAGLAHVR